MECHACGAEISERAADCPQCGASVRDRSGSADTGSTGERETSGGSVDALDSAETEPHESGASAEPGETPTGSTAGSEGSESGSPADSDEPHTGTDEAVEPGRSVSDAGEERGETGWEAAGPSPDDHGGDGRGAETGTGDGFTQTATDTGDDYTEAEAGVGHESGVGGREPTVSDSTGQGTTGPTADRGSQIGAETGTGSQRSTEAAVGETTTGGEASEPADEGTGDNYDPVEQIKELPLLTAPLAGVVTAVVLGVLSTVLGVLTPNTGSDPVTVGATVLLDLHFATQVHLPVGLLTQFDTARPPDATLGILYLLPPLFLYTAAKFVTAYNTDEETLTPVAAVGGALVAVGYFPAMLIALFLAPGGPSSSVKLLPAILLAGIFYPVFFGTVGGLVAGALSGSERRIGTLYGVVSFFLIAVGSLVLTIPAIPLSDVGLLPQIHASLFTVVAVNGLRLGGPDIGALVLLAYPMVAFVVFAAGFLRAWNAEDVTGPLRGVAKGVSPVVTYFTLLGLLATLLPLLADPWVARELGLSVNGEGLVRTLVQTKLFTIGQYVTAVFVGTLVFPVVVGGLGGTIAGTARYVLSDEN